jgi:phosphoglycerate dehydrogenase-like enzyme
MLKVGIPEAVGSELHHLFPKDIALEVIPFQPNRPFEIDFWIAPPWTHQAHQIWPWLRGVRVVQATVAGVDGILSLIPSGVVLCDARGAHTIPTAEWAVAAVLGAMKYFPLYAEVQRAGIWSRRKEGEVRYQLLHPSREKLYPTVLCEEVHGRQVLIVGYGDIGRAIEARLVPFGVEIVRVARTAREEVHGVEKLMDMLPTADVVILIVPFTSETRGMIGAQQIASMKQGALLVNAARGPVVDTDALVAALHEGRIQAAIDVTDPEPLPDGHPLWSAPNLLITPHIAGSTPMFMRRAMQFAAGQVGRYLRGEPLENQVIGEY